jgi:hypothetical protein
MITLPFQTSHALQPLDLTCFKPFKTTFRKERNGAMDKKQNTKLDKITLVTWVDKISNLDLRLVK